MEKKRILNVNFTNNNLFPNYRIILLLIISFILNQSFVYAQNQVEKKTANGTWYYEYLPADYNSSTKNYPVMFFFHGMGERGNTKGDLPEVARNGPPMHVKKGHDFPFILISPQLKTNMGHWSPNYMDEVVEHVLKQGLRIDKSRIYVTGLSLGGGGAWIYAQVFPEKIAAVAPVCGSSNNTNKACDIAAENVPVWAFHGDADGVVTVDKTKDMIRAINGCSPAIKPTAKMTIYNGVGHDSWSNAYATDNSLHNPNIYQWFMKQSRGSITVEAGNDLKLKLPTNSTNISGSAHSSVEISSYKWSKTSGPSVTMKNTSSATLSVSDFQKGTYEFKLAATDVNDNSATDKMKLTVVDSNSPPIANAGTNKQIKLPTNSISILGSGSDSDGSISAYSWRKTGGGNVTLRNTQQAKLEVSDLTAGIYKFELTVKDNDNSTDSDEMRLEVLDNGNIKPVANAGSNKQIKLPTNSMSIYGSGTDSDGSISSYYWRKILGGTATLTNINNKRLDVSNLKAGIYKFELTVKDNDNASHSDVMRLEVLDNGNLKPIANAGNDFSISLPKNSAKLVGSARDEDGQISSYWWKKMSGPSLKISNQNQSTATLNNLVEGTYTFQFKVKDNDDAIDTDWVQLKVLGINQDVSVSVVEAEQKITLPTNSVDIKANASASDGEIISYKWDIESAPDDATLINKTEPKLTVDEIKTPGKYVFSVKVTDDGGATALAKAIVNVKSEEAEDDGSNLFPTVSIDQPEQTITFPTNSIRIQTTAADSDGRIASYSWKKVSTPGTCTLINKYKANLTVEEMNTPGKYIFSITATDNDGATALAEAIVYIEAENAKAEADKTSQIKFDPAELSLVYDSIKIENVPENVSIRWFFEDASQDQYNDHSQIPFMNSGAYFVVFESNDYSVTSEVFEFIIASNQINLTNQNVRIYPNPVINHSLNIQSDAFTSEGITLHIHDLNGQMVQSEQVKNDQLKSGYRMELLNHLSKGMYQLRIIDGAQSGVFKIMLK